MNIKAVLKGFAVSGVMTFLLLLTVTVLTYFGAMSGNAVTVGVYAAAALSVIAGAITTAKNSGKNVLLNCMVFAVLYIVMLLAVSAFINSGEMLSLHFAVLLAGVLLCAFAGAVIGKD